MSAKSTNSVSTYTKILLLVFVASILFFTLFFSIYYYTLQQEKTVYETSQKQFNYEANAILTLNSEPQISIIKNVTYWNELVRYIKTKEKTWFKSTLATSLNLYKVDYIGIYDLNGKFVSSANSDKIKTNDFVDTAFLNLLHKKRLVRYYQKIPEGIIEVFAATIHPSDDPYKNKYEPSGYFFIARLLDKEYLKTLGYIANSKVMFSSLNQKIETNKHTLLVETNLHFWNHKPIAKIIFTRTFDVSFTETKKALGILIASLLVILSLVLFYLRRWIFTPLTMITRILETGNKKAIRLLKRTQGEFKQIGYLFENNNLQQAQLLEAKEKAEVSDRLKSAFLTNLSHEIRTPMNAILGFSDLLNNPNISELERDEYVKIVKNSGSNLVSIIDDLIEMSKIDSNLVTPNNATVDIDTLVQDLYDSIKVTVPKNKKITFELIKNSRKLNKKVITDPIKLRQILTNLLINAIKFTNEGYVKFIYDWSENKNELEFIVKDTGIGIDKENQEYIFDRFRRVDGDYSIKVGGLGLGLAISKAYIEMLKGEITLDSERGKGSSFKITIPVTFQEKKLTIENSQEEEYQEYIPTRDYTILIAEDDNLNFLLFEKIAKGKKYNIIRAKDGEEAVEICKNNQNIDIILMDIKMPKLGGFDAFTKIRAFNITTPIVAQTAFSSSEEIEKIKKLGFEGYITKPINKENLFSILNQFLANQNE